MLKSNFKTKNDFLKVNRRRHPHLITKYSSSGSFRANIGAFASFNQPSPSEMSGLENRSRIFHRGTVALGLTINHIKTVGEINANKMNVDKICNLIRFEETKQLVAYAGSVSIKNPT